MRRSVVGRRKRQSNEKDGVNDGERLNQHVPSHSRHAGSSLFHPTFWRTALSVLARTSGRIGCRRSFAGADTKDTTRPTRAVAAHVRYQDRGHGNRRIDCHDLFCCTGRGLLETRFRRFQIEYRMQNKEFRIQNSELRRRFFIASVFKLPSQSLHP